MNDNLNPNDGKRTMTEELEVAGNQLVDRVKELIEQGNIRRLIIRQQDGRAMLEIPLTVGVVAGGALTLFAPMLAALAVIGALVAKLRIEIVREEPEIIEDVKNKVEELTDTK